MPGAKPTIIERHSICQSYLLLNSYRAVSRLMGWSDKTIKDVVEKWKENPDLERRPGGGRPRKTTPHTDRRIIREMKKNRSITSHQLRKELELGYVCERTIRRRITASGSSPHTGKLRRHLSAKRTERRGWIGAALIQHGRLINGSAFYGRMSLRSFSDLIGKRVCGGLTMNGMLPGAPLQRSSTMQK